MHDYYNLINAGGGIEGYKIKVDEIDNEYKVPAAVEAISATSKEGAVLMTLYGTPMTVASISGSRKTRSRRLHRLRHLAGGRWQPVSISVPVAATYWSQGAAAVQFAKDKSRDLKGKKIAYIFYDNPPDTSRYDHRELQKREGFELRTFAVPRPGRVGAQVLDITQRFRRIHHRPSVRRSPSAAIKELKRAGYPLSKVSGLVWAASEADIQAAGGFGVAEGYNAMQFAGAGDDYPIRQQIKERYKKEGKEPFKGMDETRSTTTAVCCRPPFMSRRSATALKAMAASSRPATTSRRAGIDPRFQPGRPRAAPRNHPDRSRGRRLGAGVSGQGGKFVKATTGCAPIAMWSKPR